METLYSNWHERTNVIRNNMDELLTNIKRNDTTGLHIQKQAKQICGAEAVLLAWWRIVTRGTAGENVEGTGNVLCFCMDASYMVCSL